MGNDILEANLLLFDGAGVYLLEQKHVSPWFWVHHWQNDADLGLLQKEYTARGNLRNALLKYTTCGNLRHALSERTPLGKSQ